VLDKITQQSFRAAEIANGLLNFSRTSTTEFRETNLNQVIRDTLFAARAPVQDGADRRSPEPGRGLAKHQRQSGKAAAGVS
jgi:hypothetical protein